MFKLSEEEKISQVSGALAAFVDTGLLKVAEEDFYPLCEKVAYCLDDSFDLEDVANATEYVIYGGVEKTAEDVYAEILPQLGAAYLMKVAGEISSYDLDQYTDELLKEAEKASKPGVARRAWDATRRGAGRAKDAVKGYFTGAVDDLRYFKDREQEGMLPPNKKTSKDIKRGLRGVGKLGLPAAALAAAGYGGYRMLADD